MPTGRRHEINVRLAIGSTLRGLGRDGVMKLLGALNLVTSASSRKQFLGCARVRFGFC